jgi:hypothetical protein
MGHARADGPLARLACHPLTRSLTGPSEVQSDAGFAPGHGPVRRPASRDPVCYGQPRYSLAWSANVAATERSLGSISAWSASIRAWMRGVITSR